MKKQYSIIAGVGIIALAIALALSLATRPTQASTQSVVIATRTVQQGTVLTAGRGLGRYFTTQQVSSHNVLPSRFANLYWMASQMHDASCGHRSNCLGTMVATQRIDKGSLVLPSMFATKRQLNERTGR